MTSIAVIHFGFLKPSLVAVPIETVAILARQVAALDFSRDDFAAAPAYLAQGTPLAAGETIRIAVTRR